MDTFLEFLKMAAMLGGALLALAWIGTGSKKRFGRLKGERAPKNNDEGPIEDDMTEIGMMGGLMGGEMDDVFVGRHALRRAKIGERNRAKKRK